MVSDTSSTDAADQGATRRMPTSASTAASKRRRARSGARGAIRLPSTIPGNEPTSSEASKETSTVPTARCPSPASKVSGTACAMSLPIIRTIGRWG